MRSHPACLSEVVRQKTLIRIILRRYFSVIDRKNVEMTYSLRTWASSYQSSMGPIASPGNLLKTCRIGNAIYVSNVNKRV